MYTSRERRVLAGGAIGNMGEQFDYSIYALVAPTLAVHFFPSSSPTAGLLGTFAVYLLAFVARPFGGVLFGYIGDRWGRLTVLSWTVVLMGVGTMLVGLLPSYATIGAAAPVLLVLCRVLQGLSLGGETTGVTSFITESAPSDKRATWMSLVTSFVYWPAALVAVLIIGLRLGLGTENFDNWGWRIPFLLGGVVAVVGYYLRRRLEDPEEFHEARAEYREAVGPKESLAQSLGRPFQAWRSMAYVILLQPPYAVGAYLLTGYMYTFTTEQGGIDPTPALLTYAAAVAVMAALFPFTGRLSDRIGRRPMFAMGALWLLLAAYPALRLASSGSIAGAFAGQLLLAVGVAIYGGAFFVGVIELFPTAVRARGHGISYNASVAVFGGATPLIATALIGATGSAVAPAFYGMALIATFGLVGVWLVPETRDVDLRTSFHGAPLVQPDEAPVRPDVTPTPAAAATPEGSSTP